MFNTKFNFTTFLKNKEHVLDFRGQLTDIENNLTVSVGHEAYATGVPSYVNISDPFT